MIKQKLKLKNNPLGDKEYKLPRTRRIPKKRFKTNPPRLGEKLTELFSFLSLNSKIHEAVFAASRSSYFNELSKYLIKHGTREDELL